VSNVTADEIVEAHAAGLLDPQDETADDKPTPPRPPIRARATRQSSGQSGGSGRHRRQRSALR
jgi:hypothetical protein